MTASGLRPDTDAPQCEEACPALGGAPRALSCDPPHWEFGSSAPCCWVCCSTSGLLATSENEVEAAWGTDMEAHGGQLLTQPHIQGKSDVALVKSRLMVDGHCTEALPQPALLPWQTLSPSAT